jgi:predicted nucleotidyltransferase
MEWHQNAMIELIVLSQELSLCTQNDNSLKLQHKTYVAGTQIKQEITIPKPQGHVHEHVIISLMHSEVSDNNGVTVNFELQVRCTVITKYLLEIRYYNFS